MTDDYDTDEFEPIHTLSHTAHCLDELQLYGHRPMEGEADRRPWPEPERVQSQLSTVFDAVVAICGGTPLETDLQGLLWSVVNLFHGKIGRIERTLNANEQAQKREQCRQDGSEIRSVALETLIADGLVLIERRDAFETMRDMAAELFSAHIGQVWRPRSGSMMNRKALTAAMIDSRDYIAAKRRVDIEPLLPAGPRIAFTGGIDCNDHARIWDALDKARAKHPDMVLIHGGSPKGAEKIASVWADHRQVPQIVFKPDWSRHGKAAPFKRNDAMLEVLPIGVIAFPGSGISQNLAAKARKMGIKVWRFASGESGA